MLESEIKSTDEMNKKICEILLTAAKTHIPKGKLKKYSYFWSPSLSKLKHERNIARLKAEKTKCPEDVQNWRRKAAVFKTELITAKKTSFTNFVEHMDYRKDGNKIYKFLNKIPLSKNTTEPLKYNNKNLTTDREIAESLKFYAQSQRIPQVYKKEDKAIQKTNREATKSQDTQNGIFNQDFTKTELDLAIEQLQNKKSPGPDKIHPEFIKHLGRQGKEIILKLYNMCWNTTVPSDWKKAIIIPILKKNKPSNNINSFRPISLTSVIAKVMERMVAARLNWFLEYYNLINDAQTESLYK